MVQSGTGSPRSIPMSETDAFCPSHGQGGYQLSAPPPQVDWFPGSCGTGATFAREPARGGQRGLSESTPERSVGPFLVHRGTGDMSHPPHPLTPSTQGSTQSPEPPPTLTWHSLSATNFISKTRRLTQRQGLQEQGDSQGWPQHRRLRWGPWPQHGTPPGQPRGHPPRAHSGDAAPNSSSRLCPWR